MIDLKIMKKNDFYSSITAYIQYHALINRGDHILIGLSGGPDSVCLVRVLHELAGSRGFTLSAAHVDHEWRAESAEDALFCQELCAHLNIPFYPTKLSEITCETKAHESRESYARVKRRFYFKKLAQEIGAQRIGLAHHADDQMETFFIRLMRGSSIQGLSAMKPLDGLFIRPLLDTPKEEILSYLEICNQSYRIDASNDCEAFLRNRIRKHLIPTFLGIDERNRTTFFSTLRTLQEENEALHHATTKFLNMSENPAIISVVAFAQLPSAIQKRVLIEWLCRNKIPFNPSHAFLQEIVRFIEKSSQSTHQLNQFFKIRKDKKTAIIEPTL